MEQPILNGLIQYNNEGSYPWHMPGHKRRYNTIFPDIVDNPFSIDVTEVAGLDELHDPEGIILKAQERAAQIYGSDKSYYLVNGATCGVLAAISSVCSAGDTIIIARNCHKSVYNAVRLLGLKTVYVMPEWNDDICMFGGLSHDTVSKAIKEHPHAKAVVIVSPTYEGVVSDVEKIAKTAHKHKIPLIVDEAHGAHFEFLSNVNETISSINYKNVPNPAIRLGADIVIESLHKTLPAMTQCAILHYKKGLVSQKRLDEFASLYQTTSPSYVFMASMEACIEKMDFERDGLFLVFKQLLSECRKKFSELEHIHLIGPDDFKGLSNISYDHSRLVFSVKDCGIEKDGNIVPLRGQMLSEILEKEYGQTMEMAGGNYVVAISTIADTKEAFEALLLAMSTIDKQLTEYEQEADIIVNKTAPEKRMEISEAKSKQDIRMPLYDAVGRVSSDFIYVYPPGIPIVAPGEVISAEAIRAMKRALDNGRSIKGIDNESTSGGYVHVVKEARNVWLPRRKKRI
ncbi:MAG: aminotransferase class I/II-fold pyridoxal phosphate-dependent enzyme [Lachnospiraceae bacterium]|nr:aminotransferase class I/II-fold pyridoxal phosphate-dependent enzyme [Lachnospiraceae bacterium]